VRRSSWSVVTALVVLATPASYAQSAGLEATVGAVGLLSRRNATFLGEVGQGSGTSAGVEVDVRARYGGLWARMARASFSADSGLQAVGDIGRVDAGVVVGPAFLAGEVGYGWRSFTGAVGTRRWSFARLGVRSTLPLGNSGFYASLSVARYLGVSGSGDDARGSGHEAETRLTFAPSQRPFYVALGYRLEQFTVTDPNEERPEETGGIMLAGGIRLHFSLW